jgi:hypothetical protein
VEASPAEGKPLTRIIRRARWPQGIAVASACAECAPRIGSPPEITPGVHMAVIHDHHVPELEAAGWIRTDRGPEPTDIVCVHYHEANVVRE